MNDAPFDVFLHGPVFFDLVFTGLPALPRPGTEIHGTGMGSLPGGIANLAVACSRLGLKTSLAAGFGNDVYGEWCRAVLRSEGVDLGASKTLDNHTNVTVSLNHSGDRAMVTHGHPLPAGADALIGTPPPTRAVVTDLGVDRSGETWWKTAAQQGALVFADVGWDETEQWDPARLDLLSRCYAFTPNAQEAMSFTRTTRPEAALEALAARVPLAVVTLGADGAIALDRATGSIVRAGGLKVKALDATGAGDNFMSALVFSTLAAWPLEQALRFAVLCSALSVTQFGGSLSAPGWGDIGSWYDCVSGAHAAGTPERCPRALHFPRDGAAARAYSFLREVAPPGPLAGMRRAEGTFSAHRELEPH